jgi:hypothetical protein
VAPAQADETSAAEQAWWQAEAAMVAAPMMTPTEPGLTTQPGSRGQVLTVAHLAEGGHAAPGPVTRVQVPLIPDVEVRPVTDRRTSQRRAGAG